VSQFHIALLAAQSSLTAEKGEQVQFQFPHTLFFKIIQIAGDSQKCKVNLLVLAFVQNLLNLQFLFEVRPSRPATVAGSL